MINVHYIGTITCMGADSYAAERSLYNQVTTMTNILRNAGFPENDLRYYLAQIMFESNNFSSNLAVNYNNYSGIRYVGQTLASGSHNGFATYNLPYVWARDYKRVLSLKPGEPIKASSAQDFFNRLQNNGYFTQSEAKQYASGWNAQYRRLTNLLDLAAREHFKYDENATKNLTQGAELFKWPWQGQDWIQETADWVEHHKIESVLIASGIVLLLKK